MKGKELKSVLGAIAGAGQRRESRPGLARERLPWLGGDHSATPVLPWRKGSVTELLGDAQLAASGAGFPPFRQFATGSSHRLVLAKAQTPQITWRCISAPASAFRRSQSGGHVGLPLAPGPTRASVGPAPRHAHRCLFLNNHQ